MTKGGVFSYIRDHWVAYLIGAAIAVILGLGLAYFLGVKWSTPESARAEHVASEQSGNLDSSVGSVEF